MGPVVGGLAGLFGGATILTGSVLIVYLIAQKLKKDEFVGAIALMYLCSSTPIYLTLSWVGKYTFNELIVSGALMIPALAGLWFGRRIRDRVSQTMFQRSVTTLLFVIGLMLVGRAL